MTANWKFALLSAAVLLASAPAAFAESATVEIQGVAASDPGAKEQKIPPSLAHCKRVLKDAVFGTFADAGKQTVKAAAGAKGSASVAGYNIEMAVTKVTGGKAKVEITYKQGGKAIATPMCSTLSRGEPIMVQLGAKNAPTILIITLKDSD